MTNLSDLLPAGAASKQLSFTASGTIANGQTVVLQTDGTVKAAGTIAESVGTEANYQTNGLSEYAQVVADPDTGKTVIAYTDSGDSNKGKVVIATPTASGTISYGTPVEFSSTASYIGMSYDTGQDKVLLTYKGGSNHCKARVGTVSGTSISFGTELTVENDTCAHTAVAYSPDSANHLVVYDFNSDRGKARVLTISGTDVSKGSDVQFETGQVAQCGIAYDESADAFVASYQDKGNSNYGTAIVATVSGTTPSFGTAVVFESANSGSTDVAYDSSAQKVVITFRDIGNSSYPTAIVGTVSGTSISFGSAVVVASVECEMLAGNLAYDSTNNKTVIVYRDKDNENGMYAVGTVSGTSISFATPVVFNSGKTTDNAIGFDTTLGKFIIAYSDYRGSASNTPYGTAVTLQLASTNISSFLGIADAAISNAASGKITMKGGVATNSQLLPFAYTGTTGSPAVFESAASNSFGIAFDSSNNKVVVTYDDEGNSSYGTAVVGTVSGTSLSWGTPVVFNSASVNGSNCFTAFDSNVNKTVTIFRDNGNSEYGTAIVGTVSGTSISFGTKVVYNSASARATSTDICFDSTNNKLLICYEDYGNSRYGTAIVGTVSGTSISFGSEVVFDSTAIEMVGSVHDPSTGKNVVANKRGSDNNGVAQVATISGTSVSFGSQAVFNSTGTYRINAVYDSNANKVVLCYENDGGGNLGQAKVCTISGTSISFGTAATFSEAGDDVNWVTAGFDSNQNRVVVATAATSQTISRFNSGAVSGTDITFGTPQTFLSGNAYPLGQKIIFDTSQNTNVWVYKDNSNSQYGTGIAMQLSGGYPNLTPGSTYYVQDDGTLSTTSSSVTAGKAMSTNSINLDYSS